MTWNILYFFIILLIPWDVGRWNHEENWGSEMFKKKNKTVLRLLFWRIAEVICFPRFSNCIPPLPLSRAQTTLSFSALDHRDSTSSMQNQVFTWKNMSPSGSAQVTLEPNLLGWVTLCFFPKSHFPRKWSVARKMNSQLQYVGGILWCKREGLCCQSAVPST